MEAELVLGAPRAEKTGGSQTRPYDARIGEGYGYGFNLNTRRGFPGNAEGHLGSL